MKYVQIDTQSDPYSDSQPSTAKQINLSKILVEELLETGIEDAYLDESGYVYATIPSNFQGYSNDLFLFAPKYLCGRNTLFTANTSGYQCRIWKKPWRRL